MDYQGLLRAVLLTFLFYLTRCELTIKVRRGRPGYLTPQDLFPELEEVSSSTPCKVEVVTNIEDKMTQMVGLLTPHVFDCNFRPYRVKYTHNGSPLLDEDYIKMRVYNFTDQGTMSHTIRIRILITEAPYDIIVNDITPGNLEIKQFFGLSNILDSSVIRFKYNYYDGVICTVKFSRWNFDYPVSYPMQGRLVKGHQYKQVDRLKEDCRDFLLQSYRYEHLIPPSPDIDYIPLSVQLFDPFNEDDNGGTIENIYIPVSIDGAVRNTPPEVVVLSDFVLDVDDSQLATIPPEIISATDAETQAETLIFNMTKQPGENEGYFVHMLDQSKPITSFMQNSLMNKEIAYKAPLLEREHVKKVSVDFVVYDAQYTPSRTVSLHIAIHASSSTAPIIVTNRGLTLMEGQTQPITTNELLIFDKDNIDEVKIHVKSGMRHGKLEIKGSKNKNVFTPKDIRDGKVLYVHDDSDTTSDKITLRITDGSNAIKTKFVINVLPKDDSAPYMTNNLGIEVQNGGAVQITPGILGSHDKDSDDELIIYQVKETPNAGEIVRKHRPSVVGSPITKFSNLDITHGYVYYRHFGGDDPTDSFEIRLLDDNDPPNKSGKYVVDVTIIPVNDKAPSEADGITKQLTVKETEVAFITDKMLKYIDKESPDDVVYTVTMQPFYLTTTITVDAGRIVKTKDLLDAARIFEINDNDYKHIVKELKFPNVSTIHTFTQNELAKREIVYMPPTEDIGPISRHAMFVFNVQDKRGNVLQEQNFDITIEPVDNMKPILTTQHIVVKEGGFAKIRSRDISAYDPDTDSSNLWVRVDKGPMYGRLVNSDMPLVEGERFTMEDVKLHQVSYIHDGSEYPEDEILLSLSDGTNEVQQLMTINVEPINDQGPQLSQNLKDKIRVFEGGEALLTTANLHALDNNTEDSKLSFVVLQPPHFGRILLDEEDKSEFTQEDLKDKRVKYQHSGEEIGIHARNDIISFAVFDDSESQPVYTPVLGLNITVLPVDNKSPTIILGTPVKVSEGNKAVISTDNLDATDQDTPETDIRFIITVPPALGHLYNGRDNTDTPTLEDIQQKRIFYVQDNHSNIEPVEDIFKVAVTDGKHTTDEAEVIIIISPVNDEVPLLNIGEIVVEESGETIISPDKIRGYDQDVPPDRLALSLYRKPKHGKIMLLSRTTREKFPFHDITMQDLRSKFHLLYVHDASEVYVDMFSLKLNDGKHIVKQTADVKVIAINDEVPEIIRNGGLSVGYGQTMVITVRDLMSVDDDTPDIELYYVIINQPYQGVLQVMDENTSDRMWKSLAREMNFTQTDINMGRVRYFHTGLDYNEPKTSVPNFDQFVFELTDSINALPLATFDIEIMSNQDVQIDLINNGIKVQQGDSITLTADALKATDGRDTPEELIFHLVSGPHQGHLSYSHDRNIAIFRFNQLELDSQKVIYVQDSATDRHEDSMQFRVVNGLNYSRNGIFKILIDPLDKVQPTLENNVPMTVVRGLTVPLTSYHLNIIDPDTELHNLSFIIIEAPRHGKLMYDDQEVNMFSQNEINNEEIVYQSNDDSDNEIDYFLFSITDGSHDGYLINGTLHTKPAYFQILIQSADTIPPSLEINTSPINLVDMGEKRTGFIITNDNLKATHPTSKPEDIVYTIMDRPEYGVFENIESQRYIKKRFTQEDIDEQRVGFILDEDTSATNDTFMFRVQDVNRNTLADQRFVFEWSVIEFFQSHIIVCEDAGRIKIPLRRRGAIAADSQIEVKSRQLSARDGHDFEEIDDSIVTFPADIDVVVWSLQIKKDKEKEDNEKLKIKLRNPVNARLGLRDKTVVQIVNIEDGRCSEYIGMITKENPDPLGLLPEDVEEEDDDDELDIEESEDNFDDDPFFDGSEDEDYADEYIDPATIGYDDDDDEVYHEDNWDIFDLSNTNLEGLDDIINTDPNYDIFDLSNKDKGGLELLEAAEENADQNKKKNKKKKNKNKSKHPLKRYRDERKKKRNKKRDGKTGFNDEEGEEEIMDNNTTPTTTAAPVLAKTTIAPQPCTEDTKGLLYFDLLSSKMYRCNGWMWEQWGIGSNNYYSATMLQDGAGEEKDSENKREPGCPEDWLRYQSHCYKAMTTKDTWLEAESKCLEVQGHLTNVFSKKHLQWLFSMSDKQRFWIGLNGRRSGDEYEYTSGEPVKYTHWREGFPRKHRSLSKNCVLVAGKQQMINRPCDVIKARSVCTRPANTNGRRRRHRTRQT